MGAGTLSEILSSFSTPYDPNLIVGYETADDACVYKVSEDTAIIQTTDFFPPMVDDPYMFGQIAAANALSDAYAMGGYPKLALNVMSVRKDMPTDVIKEILRGGYDKAAEADTIICGGHTINSLEPIYGLAVTGFVHPDKILTNAGARPGDLLILTKPIGIGVIVTAGKGGVADEKAMKKAEQNMARLNKYAYQVMMKYTVHACTDVTGFGLMGHAYEMADGSNTSVHLDTSTTGFISEALEYAEMGLIAEGAYRNRAYTDGHVIMKHKTSLAVEDLLYDPQTSGGLLISMPEQDAYACYTEMIASGVDASIVGYVEEKDPGMVVVE